ncbi:MAG: hypothetical protein H7249_04095 [Chitinophagaceae bacterium]|nr:hypothetical protein [Oligoflexus sp.]
MKSSLFLLSALSLTPFACGKKSSSSQSPTPGPNTIGVTVVPHNKIPVTQPPVPITPGPQTAVTALTAPPLGFYQGPCSTEGTRGYAHGIDIDSAGIHPTTLLFSATDCMANSLTAWGHTDDFQSFVAFADDFASTTKALGDEATVNFQANTIHTLAKSGLKTDMSRAAFSLSGSKQLSIFISSYSAHAGLVQGTAIVDRGPLRPSEFEVHFYCADPNKKFLRQESSFTFAEATNTVSFTGSLNTWESGQVPSTTTCLVTLAFKHAAIGVTEDLAWSSAVDVRP